MLQVNVDKILPVTEARDKFNQIVDGVEGTDDLYVLTKNGKPSAVVVGVNHLEKLTGETGIQAAASATVINNSEQTETQQTEPTTDQTDTVYSEINDTKQDAPQPKENTFDTPANSTELNLSSPTPSPSTELSGEIDSATPGMVADDNDPIKPIPDDFSNAFLSAEPSTTPTTAPDNSQQNETNDVDTSQESYSFDSDLNEKPIDPFSTNNSHSVSDNENQSLDDTFGDNTISGK